MSLRTLSCSCQAIRLSTRHHLTPLRVFPAKLRSMWSSTMPDGTGPTTPAAAAPPSPAPSSPITPSPSTPAPNATEMTKDGGVKLIAHNQYQATRLLRSDLPSDPLVLFRRWLADALNPPVGSGLVPVREPEAMTLSTATKAGIPSSRVVLLKEVDTHGFVFFTNYNSRKGAELAANPYASLGFHWRETSRQIRVVGRAERLTPQESAAYFATRPRGSQIGAWASTQSAAIAEDYLPHAVAEAEKRFEGHEVPCPPHWGGWRVVPFEVEFWAGQPSRLHDRFRYSRPEDEPNGEWTIDRLSP